MKTQEIIFFAGRAVAQKQRTSMVIRKEKFRKIEEKKVTQA